jgi:tRNA-specific 2-thiouridylase
VDKSIVSRVIFPLGDWLKSDVKEYAKKISILEELATQSESQEICFVENSYIDILSKHFDTLKSGVIKNLDGKEVGTHKGYMHYTIGKRKGLFVRGAQEPHYVVGIDAKDNVLVVGKREDLAKDNIRVKDINLFEELSSFDCEVKVRYRTSGVGANVTIIDNLGVIALKEPAYGVAKGQFAVFYDGDRLLGGGEII